MARMVGLNHVALEVGDVDEAVEFYGRIFETELRGRVRDALQKAGVEIEPSRGLRFRDPWGNLVEVVQYSEVQFTKAPPVLEGMGLEGLGKSEAARKELREKGLD